MSLTFCASRRTCVQSPSTHMNVGLAVLVYSKQDAGGHRQGLSGSFSTVPPQGTRCKAIKEDSVDLGCQNTDL